jgi:hypothetical protein
MRNRPSIKLLAAWKSRSFFPRIRRVCLGANNRADCKVRLVVATDSAAMKTTSAPRLPGLEKSFAREGAAFGGLALAGLTAIWFAFSAFNNFIIAREGVIAALNSPHGAGATAVTLTNGAGIEKPVVGEVRVGKSLRIPTT